MKHIKRKSSYKYHSLSEEGRRPERLVVVKTARYWYQVFLNDFKCLFNIVLAFVRPYSSPGLKSNCDTIFVSFSHTSDGEIVKIISCHCPFLFCHVYFHVRILMFNVLLYFICFVCIVLQCQCTLSRVGLVWIFWNIWIFGTCALHLVIFLKFTSERNSFLMDPFPYVYLNLDRACSFPCA